MKRAKFLRLMAVICFLTMMLFLNACNDRASEDASATEAVGEVVSASETTEENGMDTETVSETETETETPLLWEPYETPSDCALDAAEAIRPTCTVGSTRADGEASLNKLGMTMYYTSTFYGHDRAVSRDYMQYGWNLTLRAATAAEIPTDFVAAEVTGDSYADLIAYADGVLKVYPATHTYHGSYTYNGETYASVVGYDVTQMRFSYGSPITAELGIAGVLRGAADFDRDGRADLLLCGEDGELYIAFCHDGGWLLRGYGRFSGAAEGLFAGDVDGDGLPDILYVNEDNTEVITFFFDGQDFTAGETIQIPTTEGAGSETLVAVGDIDQDGRADLVRIFRETGSTKVWIVLSLLGRGDGRFGSDEGVNNTNLYARSEIKGILPRAAAVADANADGAGDLLLLGAWSESTVLRVAANVSDGAYDYSAFGMITEEGNYRIYSGGRWYDTSDAVKDSLIGDGGYGDGDHVLVYDSVDGTHWTRYHDHPTYYLGIEIGQSGWETIGEGWWTGNTLEPEVIYVDGIYHMFTQSSGTTQSGYYGDYIGYASSTDGYTFTRKTDSPVILPQPGADFMQFKEIYGYEIGFNHEEVIYVADDPEGKCFWMYTGHFINGNFAGYVRLRSADPTTFYWSEREATSGFAEIGNQVGYINDYDGNGNRLFLRITFKTLTDEDGSRTVPTLYWSIDGLHFDETGALLAGVNVRDALTERNRNCYFLGFFTKNGTGEIPRGEDGTVTLLYLATTANAPAGMDIFASEIGMGEVTLCFLPDDLG